MPGAYTDDPYALEVSPQWLERVSTRGFRYSVHVMAKGEEALFEEAILPGIYPARQIGHTFARFVESTLGLCETCEGRVCHVIEEGTGKKFCPILFHDLVRPKWRVQDLV